MSPDSVVQALTLPSHFLAFNTLMYLGIMYLAWTGGRKGWIRWVGVIFLTIFVWSLILWALLEPVPVPKPFVPRPRYIMHLEIVPQ
jgi:hypothetical protein